MPDSDFRRELAQQLRVDSVGASAAAAAGSGGSDQRAQRRAQLSVQVAKPSAAVAARRFPTSGAALPSSSSSP